MGPEPWYRDALVTLYCGDCRDLFDVLDGDVLVTDPPYGIGYRSGARRHTLAASIAGDQDTTARDAVLAWWAPRPALVFGTWRIARPPATRARLIWDTKGALGMGDLAIPWKPTDQEIYVLGEGTAAGGFRGPRDSNVIRCPPVQSLARNGRTHPHEKPVALMRALIAKCPPGRVVDPFAGSGSTLLAARELGRPAVGVELDAAHCETIAARLQNEQMAMEVQVGGDRQHG